MELGDEYVDERSNDIESDPLRHSATDLVVDDSVAVKKQKLFDAYLTATLELLVTLQDIQLDLLKDSANGDSQISRVIDFADLGTELLQVPCTFFSDMLGGSDFPNERLPGLSRLQAICQNAKIIKLISPDSTESIGSSDTDAAQLRDKNATYNSKIACSTNAKVHGDKSGLPVKKLLKYRQVQGWFLQTNSSYLCAREQLPEFQDIHDVARQPYQDEINELIQATYLYREDPARFKKEIDDVVRKTTQLLSVENDLPEITAHKKDDLQWHYQCKDVPTYTVLAIQEHMKNLTTIQKNTTTARQYLCDVIGAVSRDLFPQLVNTYQQNDTTVSKSVDVTRFLDQLENGFQKSIYKPIIDHIYNPDVVQTDRVKLTLSGEDLVAYVRQLFDSIFVISRATLVINSMYPVDHSTSLNPIVAFSYKFSQCIARLEGKIATLMTRTITYSKLYQDLRMEYQTKFAVKLSQASNGLNEHAHKKSDAGGSSVDPGAQVSLERGSREIGPIPTSTSPVPGRRNSHFFNSSDGKSSRNSQLPSPRGATAPNPRQSPLGGSPRTPLTGSPRAVLGSPRAEKSNQSDSNHRETDVVPPATAEDTNSKLSSSKEPQVRVKGSMRTKLLDRKSRGAKELADEMSQQGPESDSLIIK
ncbi:MAG: hypothetical protein K2X50_04685 [Gammaproteobacteria bacterium]|nr:hypothetical protein [Gammaproteobacteria bacterium]